MTVKASDVAKLRKMTGAGMMDCKKALSETNGDFNVAVKIIREKGKAIANKRSDRDAIEGVVLAKNTPDASTGIMIVLNCETDFSAKNNDFINFANSILDLAIKKQPSNIDELMNLELEGNTVANKVTEQSGIIGEKIELSQYEIIKAMQVTAYIHPGNGLATLVGFNKQINEIQVGKDIAMQVAAMSPIAIDRNSVSQKILDEELKIGKEQARLEGKPEQILDKIAQGRLGKFLKENTLLNQAFVKENKKSIQQYLKETDSELSVIDFKRISLKN